MLTPQKTILSMDALKSYPGSAWLLGHPGFCTCKCIYLCNILYERNLKTQWNLRFVPLNKMSFILLVKISNNYNLDKTV